MILKFPTLLDAASWLSRQGYHWTDYGWRRDSWAASIRVLKNGRAVVTTF